MSFLTHTRLVLAESSSLTSSRIIQLKSGTDPVRNGQMVSLQSLWLTLVVLWKKIIWSGNPALPRPEALLLQLLGRTKPWVAGREPAKEEWTLRNFPSASSGTHYLSPQPYITPPHPKASERVCMWVCAQIQRLPPVKVTFIREQVREGERERSSEGKRASECKREWEKNKNDEWEQWRRENRKMKGEKKRRVRES